MLDRTTMRLSCVAPTLIGPIWPLVREMLDAGFAASDMLMPDDIVLQLCHGKRLLWIITDQDGTQVFAAAMTALHRMRSGLMCKILECGGEHAALWVHHRDKIEAYAKAEGCDRVVIEGREGWARLLPDYKMIGVVLEKRI
jgi:hypothetical protein